VHPECLLTKNLEVCIRVIMYICEAGIRMSRYYCIAARDDRALTLE